MIAPTTTFRHCAQVLSTERSRRNREGNGAGAHHGETAKAKVKAGDAKHKPTVKKHK